MTDTFRAHRLAQINAPQSVHDHLRIALDHAHELGGSDVAHITRSDLQNATYALVWAITALCEATLALAVDMEAK